MPTFRGQRWAHYRPAVLGGTRRAAAPTPLTLFGGAGLVAYLPLDEGSGQVARNAYVHTAVGSYAPANYLGAPEQNFITTTQLWTASGGLTVTENVGNNRHGNAVAARALSTNGIHYTAQSAVAVPNATQMTFSVDVKSNNGLAQKMSLQVDCGTFQVSADLNITTSWARVSFTFTTGATSADLYLMAHDAAQDNDLDALFWDARLELGAAATATPTTTFDMILGGRGAADAKDPTWASGLVYSSGGEKHAFGTAVPITLNACSIYVACKRTGSLFFADYAPLLSDLVGAGGSLHFAGQHNTPWPFFRFGTSADTCAAAGVDLDDGLVHVLAGTYDGSDVIRMYLDGTTEVAAESVGDVGSITLSRLFLGNFGFAAYWAGTIYYVLLYDVQHTQAQVGQVVDMLEDILAARA